MALSNSCSHLGELHSVYCKLKLGAVKAREKNNEKRNPEFELNYIKDRRLVRKSKYMSDKGCIV